MPTAIFRSTCPIDIVYFPFDEQECKLKFGSWTYNGLKLDVDFYDSIEEVDVKNYVGSNEWMLIGHPAYKNVKYYPCCVEPYPDLTFKIIVKRVPILYGIILILPCVLLSVLTLVIFWLPPESPAKMILGMNNFVAFFLLLRILADNTPPASASVPLIGAYFCLNMILITLSSFLSVIVINLYHRSDKRNKLPDWLRKIAVDGLARVFCMYVDQLDHTRRKRKQQNHVTHHLIDGSSRNHRKGSREKKIKSPVLKYNKWDNPVYNHRDNSPSPATRNFTPDRSPVQAHFFEQEVKEIKRGLRSFMNRLYERDATNRVNLEWRMVALVMDRMFFFIYFATIVVSLATIFPWSRSRTEEGGIVLDGADGFGH